MLRRQSSSMHRWLQGELYLYFFFNFFFLCEGADIFIKCRAATELRLMFSQWSQRPVHAALSQPCSWEHLAQLISPSLSLTATILFPAPAPPCWGSTGALQVRYKSPCTLPRAQAGGTRDTPALGHVAKLWEQQHPLVSQ